MATIKLPTVFNMGATNRFTRCVVSADGHPNASTMVFDFGPLNFIDGSGYTVLSNTLTWLIDQNVECLFINHENLSRPAISYLDDCGFFERYLGTCLSVNSSPRFTTIPCTAVEHAQAHGWLESRFSPWMCSVLDATHGGLSSVRTCMKELFHNINDHSTKNTGFVHVQHHPNVREVRVTVSDFGTGIPSTIRAKFGDMSDGAAIHLACQEGVTAKTQPNNMGAGLNYLIDRVTANQGTVRILSLAGSFNCYRANGGQVIRTHSTGNAVYPGTLVEISLDTRLFVGDEEERVEVEW